jgi:hypothetical protein
MLLTAARRNKDLTPFITRDDYEHCFSTVYRLLELLHEPGSALEVDFNILQSMAKEEVKLARAHGA